MDLPAVPRKLRRIIRRGDFVVLADLLSEHLTLSGCPSRNSGGRKFASTKPITGLDTWLEHTCQLLVWRDRDRKYKPLITQSHTYNPGPYGRQHDDDKIQKCDQNGLAVTELCDAEQ